MNVYDNRYANYPCFVIKQCVNIAAHNIVSYIYGQYMSLKTNTQIEDDKLLCPCRER